MSDQLAIPHVFGEKPMPSDHLAQDTKPPPSSAPLYRAIWRWHFYAGLLVLPFLVSLAITGGLYLFTDEINAIVYSRELYVAPVDGLTLAPSEIVKRAQAAVTGQAFRYVPAEAGDRSVEVGIETADGARFRYSSTRIPARWSEAFPTPAPPERR